MDLKRLNGRTRFVGNDIELGCMSGKGREDRDGRKAYRVYKIGRPVFEGIIYLSLEKG